MSLPSAWSSASPFSAHMQQPLSTQPPLTRANVRNDAELSRANSDQSMPRLQSLHSLLPAGSALEVDVSDSSLLHITSKSVRFQASDGPVSVAMKPSLVETKGELELAKIKHWPLPTAHSLQQGLEADKLALHHPQLKVGPLIVRLRVHMFLCRLAAFLVSRLSLISSQARLNSSSSTRRQDMSTKDAHCAVLSSTHIKGVVSYTSHERF